MKMRRCERRCEDEKMRYRPPLLEEPCAQTLSGKKNISVKQCVRSTSEMRQYICLCRCQTRVCVKIHVSIWNLTYMSNCEGSRLLACAWVPVCPCARGSGLCPGARASDVLGACCLSATRTLYSPEVSRLQAVAVCLLIPQTVCPH